MLPVVQSPSPVERVADAAKTATYSFSGGTVVVGWLSLGEWAAVIGALCAIATFFVTWYYKHKSLQQRKAYYDGLTTLADDRIGAEQDESL